MSLHEHEPGRKPYLVSWQWAENGTGMFIERVAMTSQEKEDLDARLDLLFKQGLIADVYVGDEQEHPTPFDAFLAAHSDVLGEVGVDPVNVIHRLWDALSDILEEPEYKLFSDDKRRADGAIKLASLLADKMPELRRVTR